MTEQRRGLLQQFFDSRRGTRMIVTSGANFYEQEEKITQSANRRAAQAAEERQKASLETGVVADMLRNAEGWVDPPKEQAVELGFGTERVADVDDESANAQQHGVSELEKEETRRMLRQARRRAMKGGPAATDGAPTVPSVQEASSWAERQRIKRMQQEQHQRRQQLNSAAAFPSLSGAAPSLPPQQSGLAAHADVNRWAALDAESEEEEEEPGLGEGFTPEQSTGPVLTAAELKTEYNRVIEDFRFTRNMETLARALREINGGGDGFSFRATALSLLLIDALDWEENERETVGPLLVDLLEKRVVNRDVFHAGLQSALEQLEDVAEDMPIAPQRLGQMLASVAEQRVVYKGDLPPKVADAAGAVEPEPVSSPTRSPPSAFHPPQARAAPAFPAAAPAAAPSGVWAARAAAPKPAPAAAPAPSPSPAAPTVAAPAPSAAPARPTGPKRAAAAKTPTGGASKPSKEEGGEGGGGGGAPTAAAPAPAVEEAKEAEKQVEDLYAMAGAKKKGKKKGKKKA